MRVFFDTNVLISAFTARGLCADLFKQAIATSDLVISEPLLLEIRRILAGKFKVPQADLEEVIHLLDQDALKAPVGQTLDIKIEDHDDGLILSSAIHGASDYFVTGDKEVLTLKQVDRMLILSPREFWDVLRNP